MHGAIDGGGALDGTVSGIEEVAMSGTQLDVDCGVALDGDGIAANVEHGGFNGGETFKNGTSIEISDIANGAGSFGGMTSDVVKTDADCGALTGGTIAGSVRTNTTDASKSPSDTTTRAAEADTSNEGLDDNNIRTARELDGMFSEIQQHTIRYLRGHLPNSDVLKDLCPLERFFVVDDSSASRKDLGELSKLPTELLHIVLEELDLKSLLAFSKVNKNAVVVVNGLRDWQKVVACAPDAIRLAICIRTTNQYKLEQMASALDQRRCVTCHKPAPFLDVFTLQRRCLYIGDSDSCAEFEVPDVTPVPEETWDYFDISELHPGRPYLRSFLPLPGLYRSGDNEDIELNVIDGDEFELTAIDDENRELYYLDADLEPFFDPCEREYIWTSPGINHYARRHLSSVYAPWPTWNGGKCELDMGVFCAHCRWSIAQDLPDSDEDRRMAAMMKASFFADYAALVGHWKDCHSEFHV